MRSSRVTALEDRVRASQFNDLRDDAYIVSEFLAKPSESTLSVYITNGIAYFAETKIFFSGQSTPLITMPVTLPRIDNVALDENGDIVYTEGAESANPESTKAVTPDGNVPLCEVYTRVGATSILREDEDDSINAYIRDIRGIFSARREKATEAEVKEGTDDFKLISPAVATQYIINNSPDFFITGTRSGHFSPRSIWWSSMAVEGTVTIYRKVGVGGTYASIGTASMTDEFFQDQEVITGDLYYYCDVLVDDDDPKRPNIQYISNQIFFLNTENTVIETGDYGEGLDGEYTSGDLVRGKIYQFTDFTLSGTMAFLDGGVTFIFVQGDLTITETGIVNCDNCATQDDSRGTMTVSGNTVDTVTGTGNVGVGGDGASYDTARGGAGATGYGGTGGAANPSGSGFAGINGGGGGNASSTTPLNDGGDAGDVTGWQNKILFIVGGDISIKGTLNGEGFDGGDGANAAGGGGAGAPGTNGTDFILLHGGENYEVITATLSLNGGLKGEGGVTSDSGVLPAQDGTAGANGENGDLYELLPI